MLSCLRCFPTIILPFTNGKPKRLKLKQTVENATAKIEIFLLCVQYGKIKYCFNNDKTINADKKLQTMSRTVALVCPA